MKTSLLLAALMTATAVQAQVGAGYGFATGKMDAYTPTALQVIKTADQQVPKSWAYYFADGTNAAESYSAVTGKGFPIGFDVPFCGQTMKYFAVSCGGAVRLSADEEMSVMANSYFFNNDNEAYNNVVIFGQSNGCFDTQSYEIGYEVIGQSPERSLVVTFSNYGFNTRSWADAASDSLTLHIFINENGTVQFNAEGASALSQTYDWYAGLRGVGSKDVTAISGDFDQITHARSANANMSTAVADDDLFTLTVPADVVAPTAQPTDLVINKVTATNIEASFTACEADYYLVVLSEGALNATPEAKVAYAEGDVLGNGQVIKYSTDTRFSAEGLSGSTEYTVTVFASNFYGLNGPQYNVTEPLVATVATTPAKPGVLGIRDITAESFTLDVAANAAGDKVMVVYNNETHNPGNYGVRALHGDLLATYQTGDEIEGGGKVAYFGPAAEGVVLSGLEHSLDYYFLCYSYNEQYGFSCATDTVMAAAITTIELPWAYTTMPNSLYNAPTGWTTNMVVSSQMSNIGTLEHTDPSDCNLTSRSDNHVYAKIAPMHVNQTEAVLSFDMAAYTWNRFTTPQYNAYTWLDDDCLKAIIHTAEGDDEVTLLDGMSYEEPEQLMMITYNVDLSAYYDKTIEVEIVFDIEGNGVTTLMENFRASGNDPDVTGVENITVQPAANSKQFDILGRQSDSKNQGLKVMNGQLIFVGK